MATKYWVGGASSTAMVMTATPANVEIGDVFTLISWNADGTKSVSIEWTATGATVKNVCDNLVSLWNASTSPLCSGVTASDDDAVITLTADTAGVRFLVTATATNVPAGVDNQTLTMATSTDNTGPNDYITVANWATTTGMAAAIPVDGDDVVIANGDYDILYGLDQDGIDLNTLRVYQSFTGKIGQAGPVLGAYLRYDYADYAHIAENDSGVASAAGSTRIKINFTSAATTTNCTVYNSCSTSEEDYLQPIRLLFNKDDCTLNVYGGSVGVASDSPGETATLGTIIQTGGSVYCGDGVTLTTINKSGGDITMNGAVTTIKQTGGTARKELAGTITTIDLYGGQLDINGSGAVTTNRVWGGIERANTTGTITTTTIYYGGTVDTMQSNAARTMTTVRISTDGGTFINNEGNVALTNDLDIHNTISRPVTVTVTAI